MQLYFIRHAQSTNNLLWDTTGSSSGRDHDPDLTETGWRQAARVAEFLTTGDAVVEVKPPDYWNWRGFGITHVYCSMMLRAVRTGWAISRALDVPLVAWPSWHENGGLYLDDEDAGEKVGQMGRTRSFFEQHFPGMVLPDWLDSQGWWNRSYEEEGERLPRARRVLAELLDRHGGSQDRVAVVSHGGFFNTFMTAALGLEEEPPLWFAINNVSISRFDFEADEHRIIYLNRTDFLPGTMVT